MEHVYTVHTKMIESKTHYFVKKLLVFTEFKGLANILVGLGMHTNFEKACSIAGVTEAAIRNRLLNELEKQNTKDFVGKTQKPVVRNSVIISDTVNRWLAERGVEVLN